MSTRRTDSDLKIGARPITYSLAYDPLGNVSFRSQPRCAFNQCAGSAADPARSVTAAYAQGLLTAVPGYPSGITYHPNGLLAQVTHANGVTEIHEKDPNDMARPLRLRTSGASENFDIGGYAYDGAGNVTKMGSDRFVYDLLSRIGEAQLEVPGTGCGEELLLDSGTDSGTITHQSCGTVRAEGSYRVGAGGDVTLKAGHRVALGDGFSAASGGRLTALTDPALDPIGEPTEVAQSYSYDKFGNLLSVTTQPEGETPETRTIGTNSSTNRLTVAIYDPSGNVTFWAGREYRYDPFNMLWQTKPTGGNGVSFLYGPGDERLWTIDWTAGAAPSNWRETWTLRDLDGAPLRQFRSDGGNLSGNWSFQRDYVYRGGALLAAHTSEGLHHFHLDHLGSPRIITDSTGQTLAQHLYFPFGEEATNLIQDAEALKFTGHERDDLDLGGSTADLDYMHARYFSAHLGRFQSVDPIGAAASWPESWNRYSYVLGNPLKYIDPRGMWPFFPLGDLPLWDEITIIGQLIPLTTRPFNPSTGVQGLGDLLSGRGLLNALSTPGSRRSSNEGTQLRATSDDTPGIIGFGCGDLINPAVSLGAAGGTLFGGAADLLVTSNRIELTGTLGFGLGAGVSVSPVGLSTGKSEGFGLGFASVLGMPAGLNLLGGAGLSNFFGDEPLAGANAGIGVGAGEAAAGGITYTFVLYDRCK